MKTLTEQQFDEIEFLDNHIVPSNGQNFETYGDEFDYVFSLPEDRIVTVLACDGEHTEEGVTAYVSGRLLVNRMHYMVTKDPIIGAFQMNICNRTGECLMGDESPTTKESIINDYLANDETEVDVSKVEGLCEAFTGNILSDTVETDTDGSKYVTVEDMDGDYFDVNIDKIDLP